MKDILFIEEVGDGLDGRRWCAGTCMIELGNYLSSDDNAGWVDVHDSSGVFEDSWLDSVRNWAESMGYVVVFIPCGGEVELAHRQFARGVLRHLRDLGIASEGWFSSWGDNLEK
jgi:hypothetical protein